MKAEEDLIPPGHPRGCHQRRPSKAGLTAERLDTEATLSLEQVEGNWMITTVHLNLKACIPGLTDAQFQNSTADAKADCLVSRALKAGISLTAFLES